MPERVIVHVGLPKTGSSALQNWLLSHRELLAARGVLYPEHRTDHNGISTGSVWHLLKRTEAGGRAADPSLAEATMTAFRSSPHTTLLLSSEIFATHVEKISSLLPQGTEFIAYVRNPVDFIESRYNQSVKRRGETKPFQPMDYIDDGAAMLPTLTKLAKLMASGVPTIIRPYHRDLFVGGTLLTDFLDAASLGDFPEDATRDMFGTINPSYTLWSLEFKRAMNALPLGKVSRVLDVTLQSCPLGPKRYSVISPDDRARLITVADAELARFETLSGSQALDPLREAVRRDPGRPHLPQDVSDDDVLAVADYVRTHKPSIFQQLQTLVQDNPQQALPYESLRAFFS